MSVRSMARVWESSQHAGSNLLMLLAIADFSDDDGNAYPAVATLAKKCRMKPRNAQYLLRALEQSGELSIRANKGPSGSNLYRINLEALRMQQSAGAQSLAGVQQGAPRGAINCVEGVQQGAYKPSVNHQEPLIAHNEKKSCRAVVSFDAKSHLLSLSVPEQVVTDWLSLRKAKRATPTKTAIEGLQREAEKAGISLGGAMAICCERGWQGFRADWMGNQHYQKQVKPKAGDRRTRHGTEEVFTEGCGWVPA